MTPKKNDDTKFGPKLLRIFLKLMVDGKKHSTRALAQAGKCGRGSVLTAIATLEDVLGAQLEIQKIKGKNYYSIRLLPHRNTLGLDLEVVRYLSLCNQFSKRFIPPEVHARIEETIFKLSCCLTDSEYAQRKSAQHVPVGFTSKGQIDYAPHKETIDKLLKAIRERKVCMVEYRKKRREDSRVHFLAPGRVTSMSSTLYVQGYKVQRGSTEKVGPMTLAIHRVRDITLLERRFDFPADDQELESFGLKHHDMRIYRIYFSEAASDYILERTWSSHQNIEEQDDGSIILEIGSVSEEELMAWVRSFGKQAKIITP